MFECDDKEKDKWGGLLGDMGGTTYRDLWATSVCISKFFFFFFFIFFLMDYSHRVIMRFFDFLLFTSFSFFPLNTFRKFKYYLGDSIDRTRR